MRQRVEKGNAFQALHDGPLPLLLPNAWDAETALLLSSLGFAAIGTTSLGLANALGRRDEAKLVGKAEVLANCRAIAAATDLPVTADLQNCFADDPREAAETIRLAAEAGAVGGSIEDASGDPERPIYDFTLAVERVAAAAEVARSLPIPLVLTARADNLLRGRLDLDDTIRRLQAFERAGADALYAPGVRDLGTTRRVAAEVQKPLNVVMSAGEPLPHSRTPRRGWRTAHQRRWCPVSPGACCLPPRRERDARGALHLGARHRAHLPPEGGLRPEILKGSTSREHRDGDVRCLSRSSFG